MKQLSNNGTGRNNSEMERCPGCGRHCPADVLSCGRGRAIMTGIRQPEEKQGRETDSRGGGEHRHGRHGGGGHENRRCAEQAELLFDKDESLYGLMRRCGHFLYQRRGGQGQRRVLTILHERGSMQQRELQEYLGIQPGSMSELIGKLEQKGLLKRTSSEEDRRSRILTLTEQGKKMAAPTEDAQELFGTLSMDEQEQLKTLLAKLLETWESRQGQ